MEKTAGKRKMKRTGFVLEKIVELDNLLSAFSLAFQGRRKQEEALRFYFYLEYHLLALREEFLQGSYKMEPYSIFTIYDPKERQIAAPRFRDHVAAHAIYRVISPILEKSFIPHTYASRTGKGPRKAILQAQEFSRHFPFFLKLDISHYFASIDHSILRNLLSKKFKDKKLLKIFQIILDNPISYYEKGKGIALGHLVSQIFANFYLSEMDHKIQEEWKIFAYIRYMDDFLLFAREKEALSDCHDSIQKYLEKERMLFFKSTHTILSETKYGIPFLGFLIFPNLIRLRNKTLQRARKTYKKIKNRFQEGEIDDLELQQSLSGFIEHLKIANSYRLRKKWFSEEEEKGG